MPILYLSDYGALLNKSRGRLVVTCDDEKRHEVPLETIDGLTILGEVSITSAVLKEFLSRGTCVTFLSKGGHYFGRLVSTGHVNTKRQRLQSKLYGSEFAIALSKEIVSGKIHNQQVMLSRTARKGDADIGHELAEIKSMGQRVSSCSTLDEIRGCEGFAAKNYFAGLSKCLDPSMAFNKRTRRPPLDPFNSMLSLGYSILLNEIYSILETKGLNPYFGFFHQDDENHPTLASDMMEEWRPVIVDSLALSLVAKKELGNSDFEFSETDGGVYLKRESLKKYIVQFQRKVDAKVKYLSTVPYETSFHGAMALQVNSLANAIENSDASMYTSVRIR